MKNRKLGLALSGGGYRATIYHLGTLRKLKELGLLDQVEILSTNSGGSITGASYSLHHEDFDNFEQILRRGVRQSVIGRVLASPQFLLPLIGVLTWLGVGIYLLFTAYAWTNLILLPLLLLVFLRFQFQIFPISRIIERAYDAIFFQQAQLKHLSSQFHIIINSTNLATARPFAFSQTKMGDTKYEYDEKVTFKHEHFPVARAVMASSCVPFAFTPITIDQQFYKNEADYNKVFPRLVDGGVYDNQGIHKLTFPNNANHCANVIVSDAGTNLPFKKKYYNVLTLLIRTSDVFMTRIKNFQMMDNLYAKPEMKNSIVAYQSLSFDLDNSVDNFVKMLQNKHLDKIIIEAHQIDKSDLENGNWEQITKHLKQRIGYESILAQGCTPQEMALARAVSTNLVPLKEAQIEALVKHASAITEMQVRLFLPHLFN